MNLQKHHELWRARRTSVGRVRRLASAQRGARAPSITAKRGVR